MTKLSVNLNVAALLRNRRGHRWPDVVDLGRIALISGACGLTVHPRPDQRHTTPSDVRNLRSLLDTEFPNKELNVEGYPTQDFLDLAKEVRATQVTLVPDDPTQATSDHGWDFPSHHGFLSGVINGLKTDGHRVALFADPVAKDMTAAADTGTDRVELYTGPFGSAYADATGQTFELQRLTEAARAASELGLGVNAGHDLTVNGTAKLVRGIPFLDEVSIGHALFCDALTFGMAETVSRYVGSCNASG